MDEIKDLMKWTESTKGIYRYVIPVECCYEIILLNYEHKTDFYDDTEAMLFYSGEWHNPETGKNYFGREFLIRGPVKECLEAANRAYKENFE